MASVLLCGFLWGGGVNDSMKRLVIKKCFLLTVGSVCPAKRFHFGGKRFTDDEKVEMEVHKWLRQQSKDSYAAGLETMVKRWNKYYINDGEGHFEK
jgi:hypothetical protein